MLHYMKWAGGQGPTSTQERNVISEGQKDGYLRMLESLIEIDS